MKKTLLFISFIALCYFPLFSQTLYSNSVETGNRFNPGLGVSGTPIIAFDDILIPSSQVKGTDSIKITNVKFGIRRLASAPAVTVKFYSTVVDDTATMYDNFTRIPPVQIGSIDLPANGLTSVTAIVSLGDSINKLFAIKTDTGNLFTGYQTLFLGLSFSNTDPSALNGWRITTPGAPESDNADVLWIYDVDDPQPRFATYFGGTPPASFYVQVYGSGFNTPLPVTLSDFSARKSGNVNLLNWTTQQELNTKYFAIERSKDGQNFTEIGRVSSTGNSNITRNYSYTDNLPISGINYYRLRSVDKDNSSSLSEIRTLRNESKAVVINVYPNPVLDKLNISISLDKAIDGQLSISDLNGKQVYSKSIKLQEGISTIPVKMNNYAAGTYILKIQSNDDVIIRKFNKQ